MMNLEEAMARIAELEKENMRLAGEHNAWRDLIPDGADKVAPSLFHDGRAYNNGKILSKASKEMQSIGSVVRALCFPQTKKRRNVRGNTSVNATYSLRLVDMTDEQYKTYCNVVLDILRVIENCRMASAQMDNHGSGD